MNLKKIFIIINTLAIFFTFILAQSTKVYADTATTPMYFKRTELFDDIGYSIGTYSGNNTDDTASFAQIWNIVRCSNESGSNPTKAPIYCVKAGVGFTNPNKADKYDVYFDMKTKQTEIAAQNSYFSSLVSGGNYDEILSVLDLSYIENESSSTYKDTLLNAAGITTGNAWDLTADEVRAVQQVALWYFTNTENNHENGLYDKTNATATWMGYTESGNLSSTGKYIYDSLSNYNPTNTEPDRSYGVKKAEQVKKLYNYLITTAQNKSTTGQPVKVENRILNCNESGQYYILGPIKIETTNDLPYTIGISVKNGDTDVTNYTLTNSTGAIELNRTIKELIGTNFYVKVLKSNISPATAKIVVNGGYESTTSTIWGSSTDNSAQPVVIPEKTAEPIEILLKTESNKEFDLALRKYITKVNNVTVNDTRVPNIYSTDLENGNGITTAEYKHRKDPVVVEENSIVTYNITVYNEGEKAGRATQITDQLPTGLEYVSVVSGNFEKESYDTTTNKLVLKRKSGNNTNLQAYTSGVPKSETIEITCKVTATADTENRKILTNIAWISQAIDEDGETTDRDSQTTSSPTQTASNLVTENSNGYRGNTDNPENLTDNTYYYAGQQDDDDFEKVVVEPIQEEPEEEFDLKLIKRITEVNGQSVQERIQNINVSNLNRTRNSEGKLNQTTATYTLNKEPVRVKKDDIVTYTFRVYNEGTIDGYASEITEDIPEGLEFLWSEKTGTELQNDTNLTDAEKSAIEYNQNRLWTYADTSLNTIKTPYLSKENETTTNGNLIRAFGVNDGTKTVSNLSYKEVSVKLKVISENEAGSIIRNEAAITADTDADGNDIDDRDSSTDRWVKYEDDEDYDNIILEETPEFDLALRKFIIAVSKDTTLETNEFIKNNDGSYTRGPMYDASKLNTKDSNNNKITTAEYNHTKTAVNVEKGDIVVYMLRVYNEGDIDGYAAEITDHLPPYLEFVEGDFNTQYGWEKINDRTIKTTYLSNTNQKINKISQNSNGSIVLNYKEVPIMCRVKSTAIENQKITNIADITKYWDGDKQVVEDRDSDIQGVILPSDANLPSYKDNETGAYIPGQQDDDDFEKVIVIPEEEFDLALRKFIVAISEDTTIEDNEYLKNSDGTYTREPIVDTSKLNTYDENDKLITTATYTHSKEPLLVKKNDIVIYMLRVYNEGEEDGYAAEIKDHLPPYLEFVKGDFNTKYGWNVSKDGRTVTTTYLRDELIKKPTFIKGGITADGLEENAQKYVLSYKEVPIMCKVKDTAKTNENITNIADITKYLDEDKNDVEDRDSEENNIKLPNDKDLPGYSKSQEDDDDFEKIIVKEFDLALRKWVTQAIVNENGKQSIKNTGHKPYDDPEQVVKVEINKKKINQVIVKFKYSIRVINEGDVEGYAKEVTDYIPQGLKFVAADNPNWKDEGNNVISTRQLENTLLKPGEYADVEVILTWINGENNMGVKTNIAEISEDYNKYGLPDRDSTPDNKKSGEDDIDDAPVMLSISTGQVRILFTLGFVILITIAGGITLIKKYVL